MAQNTDITLRYYDKGTKSVDKSSIGQPETKCVDTTSIGPQNIKYLTV
jgi:hypothetical protein